MSGVPRVHVQGYYKKIGEIDPERLRLRAKIDSHWGQKWTVVAHKSGQPFFELVDSR